ncbi:MAG: DUF4058 family protein [Gemmataceae bacterium]
MPLLDHFRPPLSESRHWESFHGLWAGEIVRQLNRGGLPHGYFAEAQVQIGGRVEIDVATFDGEDARPGTNGAVAVATWAPPAATMVLPAVFPDEIEVRVFASSGGPTLVAAVELVSPANKDRPASRRAFAAKCAANLHAGIGLVVVDVVTERLANLHDEMVALMNLGDEYRAPAGGLSAVAYRPGRTAADGDRIETWCESLAVGRPLPTMPLALRGGDTVRLDLEAAYKEARAASLL